MHLDFNVNDPDLRSIFFSRDLMNAVDKLDECAVPKWGRMTPLTMYSSPVQ